jgi:hypothetical protein
MEVHDIHDFIASSQRAIEDEYARIQKRAAEDPGTAGDQGEENWKALFESWLPSYFHEGVSEGVMKESVPHNVTFRSEGSAHALKSL